VESQLGSAPEAEVLMGNLIIESTKAFKPGEIMVGISDGDGNYHSGARALVIRETTREAWIAQLGNNRPGFHKSSRFYEVSMD
jgi:hypothetical protein